MDWLADITRFYEHEGREELRLRPQSVQHLEFRTAVKYLDAHLRPGSKILDSCAGTGLYAFYLARAGHSVTAGDVVPYNVERLKKAQAESPLLADVFLGDARDLSRFDSSSFQAVLCMGALYHLHKERDRELVLREGLRLLESGGAFVCTYMNRYAVALSNVINPASNQEEIAAFMASGVEGVFYAATPAEMENMLRRAGLGRLLHVALDGPVTLLAQQRLFGGGNLRNASLERFAAYHASVCEEPHLLGYGYHNMLIGWKE